MPGALGFRTHALRGSLWIWVCMSYVRPFFKLAFFSGLAHCWTHALQGSYEFDPVRPSVHPFFYHNTFFRISSLVFWYFAWSWGTISTIVRKGVPVAPLLRHPTPPWPSLLPPFLKLCFPSPLFCSTPFKVF